MSNRGEQPDVQLEMFSQPRFLSGARAMVAAISQRLGFNEIESGQISLAVDEALCNVIKHGYGQRHDGRIWISLWALGTDPPEIEVVIEDLARQVDTSEIKSRDLDCIRPGGLGVHLMRQIMDEVRFEHRDGGGMRLTMTKKRREKSDECQEDCLTPPPACESEPKDE